MKKIHQLSFRMQIFLSSLILVIFPTVLLSTINAISKTSTITSEYNTSTAATLTQMNQSLDTLLENALKIADTPLLNDDARKAMITNYEKDYLSYAQDFNVFRNLMRQTNQLNSSMLTVYFQNRYGYSFEYNVKTAQQRHTIESNMEKWKKIAETSKNRTYFAPLQTDSSTGHSILPMVKILLDRYDYQETGLCYAEIDFTPIMEILSSSCETQNTLLIYNADNKLTCTINLASFSEADISSSVLSKLEDFSNTLTSQDAIGQSTLKTSLGQFVINGCINNTTQWHIVQIISNEKIAHTFHDTIISYLGIFLFCALLGLILAIFLSRILTRPVSNLCHEIDILDPSDGSCIVQYEGSEIPKEYLNQRVFFNLQGKQYEITVEAVSYDTQYSGRDIGASLIVSQDYLNSLISKPTTLNMYIYYNQKYDEVLEKKITSLVEDSPYSNDLHIESQFENMRTIQESQGEMMEIGTIIALLLLLVGVLNYTNTIASSIQNRKLTFSVMESIGMSKKQINQLLIREGVLYALFSVFITLTIGSVITYICFESMNYMEIPFNVPVFPLFSAIILVMLICMITPLLSYKKLAGNRSIVERLRDYE